MSRTTLLSLAAAATLAIPAAAASPASAQTSMSASGFYVAGFGACWYGETRPDSYFGLNVQCPVQPMPGDTRNGG